jgi:hypothetical protein
MGLIIRSDRWPLVTLSGMQMDSQPHRPFGHGLDGVCSTSGQEQVISGFQHYGFAGELYFGFAAQKDDPLVLRLNVSVGREISRTDDALDDEIPVRQENVEALAGTGRRAIFE